MTDAKTKGWTHIMCEGCFEERSPFRIAVRQRVPQVRPCCFCGSTTASGIYCRAAPADVPNCQGHEP